MLGLIPIQVQNLYINSEMCFFCQQKIERECVCLSFAFFETKVKSKKISFDKKYK